MLEADLEKSKGDKENAVAEERMKARSARAQFFGIWIWMDPVLPKGKSPCLTGATFSYFSWEIMDTEMVILLERLM